MSQPLVSQPVYPGTMSHGMASKRVMVMSIDQSRAIAQCQDEFGKAVQVRCDIMRAKGNVPEPREWWVVDRQYGDWSFAAILNGGTGGVVVPQDNVPGLPEALDAHQNLIETNAANTAAVQTNVTNLDNRSVGQIAAKGDLLGGTATDTAGRLPVGTPVQQLVPDPSTSTGLSWKTPFVTPTALTGATYGNRYVGNTYQGAPTTGTFQVGDWVMDTFGYVWVCWTSGSPGTWVSRDNIQEQPGKHIWSWTAGSVAANVNPVMATGYTAQFNAGIATLSGGYFFLNKAGRWHIGAQVESDCGNYGNFHSWFAMGNPNPIGPSGTVLGSTNYRASGFAGGGYMRQSFSWTGWVYQPDSQQGFSLNFWWNSPAPTAAATCNYRVNLEYLGPL